MKIFPDKETLNKKPDLKTIIVFIIVSVTFALLTTFQRFEVNEGIKIIAYSLISSAVLLVLYVKIDSIRKVDKKMKNLSFGIIFSILLLVSRIYSNMTSQFLKHLLFWISVELLSVGFLTGKIYENKTKKSVHTDAE